MCLEELKKKQVGVPAGSRRGHNLNKIQKR